MERSLWSRAWPAAASAAASLGLHAAHVVAVLVSSGVHSHAAHPGYSAWVTWAAWGANAIAAVAVGRLLLDYWRWKRRGQRARRLLAAAVGSTFVVVGSILIR